MDTLSKNFGKLTIPLLVLLAISFFASPARAKYGGGKGEPNDPYLILDANHMNAIGADPNDWDKHFMLMADIDLGAFTGTSFNIIGYRVSSSDNKPFTGVFDGNDHTISNFTYTSTGTNYIGLFGYVDDPNAEIRNLGLIEPNLDAGTGRFVGALVGYIRNGTITNCYIEGGSVSGRRGIGELVGGNGGTITDCYASGSISGDDRVGGLVGSNGGIITNCNATTSVTGDDCVGGLVGENGGTITNCYSTGSVSGETEVGGLVGENSWHSTITDCYSEADVSGNRYVGGLVGYNYSNGTISNCYSHASVTGIYNVGGLVGYNRGTISNCYSEGNISGTYDVGGLVGWNHRYMYAGTITNCYSTGSVTRESAVGNLGGLVGCNEDGDILNSFWDIETSGQTTSSGGTGLPTEEMQMANTFVCWGYEPVWTIEEGVDYPRLVWENAPGELITPPYYGGGSGEPNDPYLIYTAEQLNTIGLITCDWDKHFKLMADIDLSGFPGTSFNIIGYFVGEDSPDNKSFTGVFDGNVHTISNFSYTSTDTWHIGLFGFVSEPNAVIKDLGLINPNVNAGTGLDIGSLVGLLSNGTITNCYVEGGSVSGTYDVGGLVGENHGGTITDSYTTCSVSGDISVGGLVGENDETIFNCYSTASVSGGSYIGGLVGYNEYGTITNSYSSGDVSGDEWVGGLVGVNEDEITSCYSTGSVTGNWYVGGLVGHNIYLGTISNCYSKSDVSGDYDVGGLVGANGLCKPSRCYPGTISNCYSIGSVEGTTDVGGLVGYNEDGDILNSFWDIETSGQTTSDGGTGKTTAEMKTPSTFIAWMSCEPIWTIDEGKDYPRLAWENMPGEFITIPSGSYAGGSGDPDDPYLIYTTEQLNMIGLFSCDWDKCFRLMSDIDLVGFTGTSFNIIGNEDNPFTGVFDGNSHTISNFTYTSAGTDYIGISGFVKGEIKDLGLIDANVDAGTGNYVGSLVGYLKDGTITNCYVQGGDVSGNYSVGGLVGYSNDGMISDCYSKGHVSGDNNVGGLVGSNDGTITNCYSTGSVSGTGKFFVGGLMGGNMGTISNCYSTASVSGTLSVGGLVGVNAGTINNCYSTGSISGESWVGGLVGDEWGGEVYNSFWDIETSGQTTSAGGTGLPTDQMQTMSTFTHAGWDFVGETVNGIDDLWFIPQQDYPHLWWEGMQVPMKLTPRTLNCRSKGNWVKAHLTLPQGFTVADVDADRPAVLHSFGFESAPLYVFVNENERVQIEAAFEREAVCSLTGDWPEALTVAGFLTDGNIFLGTSTVRMITPGMKEIGELASYWLNADCVQPDFCNGIDMNRDSLVNLLDYALLMNSQVEFVSE